MHSLNVRTLPLVKSLSFCLIFWVVSFFLTIQDSFSQEKNTPSSKATSINPSGSEIKHPPIASSSSCSGRGCHGGSEPVLGQIVQQNEFSTWLAHDKHANAYQSLLSDRAKTMAKNLGIPAAHKDLRCLACHTTPQIAKEQSKFDYPLDLGVGCESCHGTASPKWLGTHTTDAWKNTSSASKKALYDKEGMNYLGNAMVQAQVCVGCHVGAPANPQTGIPARDANHDIMAAGHPRLTFEAFSYQTNMPPHWNTKKYSSDTNRDLEIWVTGQLAGLSASIELSSHRAELALNNQGIWPEFAESSCLSCHADFQQPSWRDKKNYYEGRKPGSLPYDSWTAVLLSEALLISGQDKQIASLYNDLAKARNSFRTSPKEAKVSADILAGQLAKIQNELVSNGINTPKEWRTLLLDQLSKHKLETATWNESTQIALALSMLSSKKPEQAILQNLWENLAYPSGYESPKGYSPDPKALEGVLQKLKSLK
jgi:hypothetical protein